MFSLFSCSGGRLSFPKVEINPPSLSLSLSASLSVSRYLRAFHVSRLFVWATVLGVFPSVIPAWHWRRDADIKAKTIGPVQRHKQFIDKHNGKISREIPPIYTPTLFLYWWHFFSKGKSLNWRLWLQTFYSLNKNSFKLISFFKKMLSRPSTGFHLKRVSIRS